MGVHNGAAVTDVSRVTRALKQGREQSLKTVCSRELRSSPKKNAALNIDSRWRYCTARRLI